MTLLKGCNVKKVILVTSGDTLASLACQKLFKEQGQSYNIVAVINSAVSFSVSLKILKTGLKSSPLGFVLYALVESFGLGLSNKFHKIFSNEKYVKPLFEVANELEIPIIALPKINSQGSVEQIQTFDADLLLSVRPMQIFRMRLLNGVKRVINLHCTALPKYRGIGGIFQAMSNAEKSLGYTVHVIDDEKVDAGPIVAQKACPNDHENSLLRNTLVLYDHSQELLIHALNQEAKDQTIQEGEPSYFSWPSPEDQQRFKKEKNKFWAFSDFFFSINAK